MIRERVRSSLWPKGRPTCSANSLSSSRSNGSGTEGAAGDRSTQEAHGGPVLADHRPGTARTRVEPRSVLAGPLTADARTLGLPALVPAAAPQRTPRPPHRERTIARGSAALRAPTRTRLRSSATPGGVGLPGIRSSIAKTPSRHDESKSCVYERAAAVIEPDGIVRCGFCG